MVKRNVDTFIDDIHKRVRLTLLCEDRWGKGSPIHSRNNKANPCTVIVRTQKQFGNGLLSGTCRFPVISPKGLIGT